MRIYEVGKATVTLYIGLIKARILLRQTVILVKYYQGDKIMEGMGGACGTHREGKIYTGICWYTWRDEIYGRIILKWIFMIENVNALTGFIWFRLGGEWRDVNTMKNSRVTKKKIREISLRGSIWGKISLSVKPLINRISYCDIIEIFINFLDRPKWQNNITTRTWITALLQ